MNEQSVLIPLDQIDHNPYQPRHGEDPAVVQEIADSIGRNGLMQVPTARQVGSRYQLAFGHTRLAAFRLLTYGEMPLIIRDLTDLQMFELGVAENIKRRDLNPIEEASSMRVYMDGFGKTSEETGEFFNVSAETVRGKVRLLNLPEKVKEQLQSGEIKEGTARSLLTAARVLDEAEINDLAKDLGKGGYKNSEDISDRIDEKLREEMFTMYGRWEKDKETPRGGAHLWPLTWKHAGLPAITPAAVIKTLEIGKRTDVKEITPIVTALNAGMQAERGSLPAEVFDKIQLLINPPACTECPQYVKLDGVHYCGLKACWTRKRQAFINQEFNKVVTKLGMPVYNKETDGPCMEEDYNNRANFKKRFAAKDPDLRLKPHFQDYNKDDLTGSYYAIVVDVNKERVANKKKNDNRSGYRDDWNSPANVAKRERENQLRERGRKFFEQALPIFGTAFDELTNISAMEALVNKKTKADQPKAKRLQILHEEMASDALREVIVWGPLSAGGPLVVAKHLQGVAKTWGIKLPKDWDERAQALMPAEPEKKAVAAETPSKAGRTAKKKVKR